MELYCSTLHSFVEMAKTEFSIQAESQYQNLDNYTVLNSFDIEIIHNTTNTSIVQNRYPVLCVENGVPIYQGYLIQIGMTNPDVIKVVYKALPANGCFRNFRVKEKLKDYFFPELNEKSVMFANDVFGGHDTRGSKNPPKFRRIEFQSVDDYYRSFTGYCLNWYNYLEHCWCGFADIVTSYDATTAHQFPCNKYELQGNPVSYTPRNFMYVPIYSLLWAMGLEVPSDWATSMPSQGGMIVNVNFKCHYILKIVMSSARVWQTDGNETTEYDIEKDTEIWIQPTEDGVWNDSKPSYQLPQSAFANSMRTIWKSNNKLDRYGYSPVDMTIHRIDYWYTEQAVGYIEPDRDTMETHDEWVEYKGKKWWVYREFLEDGVNWEKGKRPYINNGYTGPWKKWKDLNDTDKWASYAVAYAEVDFNLDYVEFMKGQTSGLYAYNDVPVIMSQMTWLDTDLNQFFAEVSLNSTEFKWLRNPMFVTPDNKDLVHGNRCIEDSICEECELTDENIITASKEIDYEAPSRLTVGFDNGVYGYQDSKTLNDSDNETTTIKQQFISVPYRLATDHSHPVPVFYIKSASKDMSDVFASQMEYQSQSVKGFLCSVHNNCTVNLSTTELLSCTQLSRATYDGKGKLISRQYFDPNLNVRAIEPQCTAYDYMARHLDHTEKITIQCTGYKFQDKVDWNGRKYEVGSYKTSDMQVFQLTLYPYDNGK